MAAPAPNALAMLGAVNDRQNIAAIQLDKRGVLKLGPRMRPRPGRDQFKQIVTGQLIEKLMQVSLDRLNGFLEHKEHDDRKSQLPIPSKIFGPQPMAGGKVP